MKTRNITILLLGVLLSFSYNFSKAQQDTPFDKDYFTSEQKDALKDAIKQIKAGDKLYEDDIPVYDLALEHYLKANEFNPNNALLNYRIGKCYLHTVQKPKSLAYLEKARALNPKVEPDLLYLLARSYHLNLLLDKAIKTFEEYKGSLSPKDLSVYGDDVNKKIDECEVAKEMISHPIRIFVDNLGKGVNSKYPEYGPFINADEDVLMFTSSRDNTTGGKIDNHDLKYFEDIYIAKKSGEIWRDAVNPGKPLNTDSHDAIVGVSPDGKHALIYKGEDNGGDLFECRINEEGEWGNPKRLPKEVNTKYHESSACFSPDMEGLYFVSDKPGGFGGSDIYYTSLRIKGNREKLDYEDAVNLGAVINTPYDEEGVFMDVEGKTLYFSSEGHNSMGGFDVFKSTLVDGKWTKPENMGYPLNTPDDDIFFSFSRDGRHAYYSSFDETGYGNRDIYMITLLGPEKEVRFMDDYDPLAFKTIPVKEDLMMDKVELKEFQLTIVKGTIMDAVTLVPLGGIPVEIYDNALGRVISSFQSNTETGEYLVSLPSGRNYGFSARAKDYLFHSENLIIPPTTTVQEITLNMLLNKIKVGSKIILRNIFFDFNKTTLRPTSTGELDRLAKMLKDIPKLKIEISGHTDNVGSDAYNKKLSEGRAKAVVDYLIKKGIASDRLTFVGYGESQPIESNDTEEGRQMNRRTEFKVLSR